MLGAAVIVFRETLEAALIIGIIGVATQGLPGRRRWLLGGGVVGVFGSFLVASMTEWIASLAEGGGQELFNAGVLGLAALMLAWHNIWMARHGAQMAGQARRLGEAVGARNQEMSAVGLVVALCILREGAETVLFLYGLYASGEGGMADVLGGAGAGLLLGAGFGYALYAGFLKIPARWFFGLTSGLVVALAASMTSQMARFLVQADYLPSLASPLWDSSWLLDSASSLGSLLHTLVGYEARPLGIQVAFYLSTIALIGVGMRLSRPRPRSITASN